jgi:hypothetical protein
MNRNRKICVLLLILTTLVIPASAMVQPKTNVKIFTPMNVTDFDPLDDNITVTVTIKEIRALKTIDLLSDPDFYVKVKINEKESVSDVWENMKYVESPNWSASNEVPKDTEFVNITIELLDKNSGTDRLCDISPDSGTLTQARTAELTYSIATGIWWGRGSLDDDNYLGDDYLQDPSGYGRLNGCDDNSIHQQDRDCELWFTITQNDFDGDGLPYWLEVNMYNSSPLVNNRGEDMDNDGIPIEWEYTFGLTFFAWGHDEGYHIIYDPYTWENHTALDSDNDGLNNIEEYKTWQWGSDPFRQDLFLEIDQMEKEPGNQEKTIPLESYDLIRDSHARHNVVWHIDDGRLGGGEMIPYKADFQEQDLNQYYWDYFMHQNASYWRRGVFHWGILGYNVTEVTGFSFSSRIGQMSAFDCFYLPAVFLNSQVKIIPLISSLVRKTFNSDKQLALIYAGVIMHETGHSLDIWAPGSDLQDGMWPWQMNYWRFGSYKSVMNYRYVYSDLVDYSDGSRGKNDFNDWSIINMTNINPRSHH